MIDIHHHLIYGVDDGSPDLETSLLMARTAAADGVTHIVCTPHANNEFTYSIPLLEERVAELRHHLKDEIELSLGCDFHLTVDNIFDASSHPLRYSINGKGYLMIEFANDFIPSQMTNALLMLQSAGYTLVITHPERYPALLRHPNLLAGWVRDGCLVQVTCSSLYGRFGRRAEAFSNELLERDWVHFVATDAHNLTLRPPHMRKAYEYVAQKMGEDTANRIFVENPRAVVEGKKLSVQPMPDGLMDDAPFAEWERAGRGSSESGAHKGGARRGFWDRMLHRGA